MSWNHASTATIPVQMKRGGTIMLEAKGFVYNDCDGAGQRSVECDDFKVFWNGRGKNGKRYEVSPKLFNVEAAEQSFIEAI